MFGIIGSALGGMFGHSKKPQSGGFSPMSQALQKDPRFADAVGAATKTSNGMGSDIYGQLMNRAGQPETLAPATPHGWGFGTWMKPMGNPFGLPPGLQPTDGSDHHTSIVTRPPGFQAPPGVPAQPQLLSDLLKRFNGQPSQPGPMQVGGDPSRAVPGMNYIM